jgi:hypothetical protein
MHGARQLGVSNSCSNPVTTMIAARNTRSIAFYRDLQERNRPPLIFDSEWESSLEKIAIKSFMMRILGRKYDLT